MVECAKFHRAWGLEGGVFAGGGVGVWVGGAGFGWFLGTPSDSQPVNLIAVGLDL